MAENKYEDKNGDVYEKNELLPKMTFSGFFSGLIGCLIAIMTFLFFASLIGSLLFDSLFLSK